MVYKLFAHVVLLLHLAFIIYVLFGGLLALKNEKWALLHVPATAWGCLIEFADWICPLTPLENWLLIRAGASIYQEGFIAHYILPLIYPTELARYEQVILGTGIILINLPIYLLVLKKIAKRSRITGA